MKKIIFALAGFLAAAALCAQTINARTGYKDLKWGMTVDEVKKSYKLTPSSDEDRAVIAECFIDGVEAFAAKPSEKSVAALRFYFYDGRLFLAEEDIPTKGMTEKKLFARYGKLNKMSDDLYNDYVFNDGKVTFSSIFIVKNEDGSHYFAWIYDWNVYSKATKSVAKSLDDGIVSKLRDLSSKLVQAAADGEKPTYAFVALTSDDGNALLENYVTDALTEAMFNTGNVKIVERASIEKIMSEQKFQSSALVNERTAVEIGNLSGANYVCYGTVKDLGAQISLNVKVVEVSTAELCAMGRETVGKDKYLSDIGYEKRGTGGSPAGGTGSAKPAVRHVENNLWQSYSFVNDFDDYTQYTFMLKGSNGGYITVGLTQSKIKFNSKALVLLPHVAWNDAFDFKTEDGNVTTAPAGNRINWSYQPGKTVEGRYKQNASTKWIFDALLKNEVIVLRTTNGDKQVEKFQTAGLEEKIIEAGISVQDFYNAYSNEEF